MNKFFRNILIGLITSVGLFVIIIVVLEALGVDTGLRDICSCGGNCCKKSNTNSASNTKIKRNYTELKLPEE